LTRFVEIDEDFKKKMQNMLDFNNEEVQIAFESFKIQLDKLSSKLEAQIDFKIEEKLK